MRSSLPESHKLYSWLHAAIKHCCSEWYIGLNPTDSRGQGSVTGVRCLLKENLALSRTDTSRQSLCKEVCICWGILWGNPCACEQSPPKETSRKTAKAEKNFKSFGPSLRQQSTIKAQNLKCNRKHFTK